MHDGSILTLSEAIDHYKAGGRTIKTGPRAGAGYDNPNKSEFIKSFDLSASEKEDLLAFLRSLTDQAFLSNPRFADPWIPQRPAVSSKGPVAAPPKPKYLLDGEVVQVFPEDGAITLYHDDVPGFMSAMRAPYAMEFLVPDRQTLATLRPGMRITAGVRKRGSDYILEQIRKKATSK
jgi:Cu/Ag efflux protein CusF